jgi:hypothetical protein
MNRAGGVRREDTGHLERKQVDDRGFREVGGDGQERDPLAATADARHGHMQVAPVEGPTRPAVRAKRWSRTMGPEHASNE